MNEPRREIDIQVDNEFLVAESEPDSGRFVFAYTITLANTGEVSARLLTHHWVITNADGLVQEVHGAGVIGERPYLAPGGRFRYTSGTVLATPVGTMQGCYQWVSDDGVAFDAPILPFRLAVPGLLH